jgi:hypothetical protein
MPTQRTLVLRKSVGAYSAGTPVIGELRKGVFSVTHPFEADIAADSITELRSRTMYAHVNNRRTRRDRRFRGSENESAQKSASS